MCLPLGYSWGSETVHSCEITQALISAYAQRLCESVCVCVCMQKAFYGTATPCFECTPAQRHQAYKGMRSNAELYLTQIYCLFKNIDGALLLLYKRVQKGQQSFEASKMSSPSE